MGPGPVKHALLEPRRGGKRRKEAARTDIFLRSCGVTNSSLPILHDANDGNGSKVPRVAGAVSDGALHNG
jgi:hypothetical protein